MKVHNEIILFFQGRRIGRLPRRPISLRKYLEFKGVKMCQNMDRSELTFLKNREAFKMWFDRAFKLVSNKP